MDKIIYTKKYISAILIITTLLFSCNATQTKNTKINNNQETWITIFLHGIVSAQPVLSFKTIRLLSKDLIENTIYEKYVENVRPDPYFNANQAKQGLGLQSIDLTKKDAKDGCAALANIFEKQYKWMGNKSNNLYYTFGWTGFLSRKKRYQDAIELYKTLSRLTQNFKTKGVNPKIRLIGFSNGAGLCLDLPLVIKQENLKRNFKIDELIMLGMPIQRSRDFLICDPIFGKKYHFYSGADRIQILDLSDPYKFFSRRKFKTRLGFKLPKDLIQVKLQLLRKSGRWANSYKKGKLTARHAHNIKECSPGHCEWFFFGWTNKFYRDNFAIDPLPVVSIIPTLINIINESGYKSTYSKRYGHLIKMSVRPYDNAVVLRRRRNKKVVEFIPDNQFDELKNIAKSYPFKKTTKEEYNKKVQEKLKMAKEQMETSS